MLSFIDFLLFFSFFRNNSYLKISLIVNTQATLMDICSTIHLKPIDDKIMKLNVVAILTNETLAYNIVDETV